MEAVSRRSFIRQSGLALGVFALSTFVVKQYLEPELMKDTPIFDAIIIGGSYAGLAAGMALGRSLRQVLIIDSGKPCNRMTPYSHNFLTHDGDSPQNIARIARQQVEAYPTVQFLEGIAESGIRTGEGFAIRVDSGKIYHGRKLIFATGIKDMMPAIPGFTECWGISVLHCPYCHGYEVRNQETGILLNTEHTFEYTIMISNWTKALTLFTNGPSPLTAEQGSILRSRKIDIIETEVDRIEQTKGQIETLVLKDGTRASLDVLYGPRHFEQHCPVIVSLGCELTGDGFVNVDGMQKTSLPGVYACGDNCSRLRTVANAVATGATAGMMLNKEIILEGV